SGKGIRLVPRLRRGVLPTGEIPDVGRTVQDVVDTAKVQASVKRVRFPNLCDIGADSIIVGDVDVAIATEVAVPVEFIAAKELASGQLANRGGREAQRCEVEAHVSRTKTLFNETVKGNPHVADEGSRECPHPIHCGGPIQALERLLASLPRAAENTIVVAIFGAAVLSVASKDAV